MSPLPLLFLNVEQGPKAGCRVECNAAVISTVGRARCNTLQISRDAGISQKHLRFQWSGDGDKDDDAHVGWIAIDAGSSNGTLINAVLVEPHKGILIHSGDLIKIGSATTIKVEILGIAHEVMAAPQAKKRSKRTATCIASESHGKGTPVASRRHACKAGCAACKALPEQECEGKQLKVTEGEVCQGKHHIHDEVKGHRKQKDDMRSELPHSIIAEGHAKQQDETADMVVSQDKHTSNAAEGHGKEAGNITVHRQDQGKQGRRTRAQDKHGINNVVKGKQENDAKALRDHEHASEIVASSADIDLGMTVEQWFHHMMEEGPKYLYKVSESIIQDIMLESKQFDKYVLSLR